MRNHVVGPCLEGRRGRVNTRRVRTCGRIGRSRSGEVGGQTVEGHRNRINGCRTGRSTIMSDKKEEYNCEIQKLTA